MNKLQILGAYFAVRKTVFGNYGIFNASFGSLPGKLYARGGNRLFRKINRKW